MKTEITDSRRAIIVDTAVLIDYVEDGKPLQDVERDHDGSHVDTRKLFIWFETGEAADWTKKRIVYGPGYSTSTHEIIDTWRPAWVAVAWSKRSASETWVMESVKLKNYNIKQNGKVGKREEDVYMWTHEDYMRYLPSDVVKFIEDHAPELFSFFIIEEEAHV